MSALRKSENRWQIAPNDYSACQSLGLTVLAADYMPCSKVLTCS